MPAIQIVDYLDEPSARRELAGYLTTAMADLNPEAGWEQRLAHWWDENPFADLHPARGWVVRRGGDLAGFLAVIPVGYSVKGTLTPGLAASTWVIDPDCRHVSLPMFMKMKRLGATTFIADTTPSPEVQAMMDRTGWRSEREVRRHYFSPWGLGQNWPTLKPGLRCVASLDEVTAVAGHFRRKDRIEKWVTVESLRWQLESPSHGHRFLGVIDESGTLSSYQVLAHKPVKGIPAWASMEAWTAHETTTEFQAMTGAWLTGRACVDLPRKPLFTAAAFSSDDLWTGAPFLHVRTQSVCHFFCLPKAMEPLPKHTVMAEGDLGL